VSRAATTDLAAWTVAVLLGVVALPAAAQADSAYDVGEDSPIGLRALIDVRVVRQGPQPSWLENGPGKTRYGGEIDDGEASRITRFALSQLALEPFASLPWGVRFQAQLNWDIDIAVDGDFGAYADAPRLIEGFFRREWGGGDTGWAAQAGVMTPPYSLENNGPAWTPEFTLTPSAMNTWLWEEGRPVGLEGEWWRQGRDQFGIDCFAGMGWGTDSMGVLLSQRGWVLSDYLSGINSDLPIPATGGTTRLFEESDGRPALYAGAKVADPTRTGELRLGYFDNLADLGTPGVWETRYGQAGVALTPLAGLEIAMQGLIGNTVSRSESVESRFNAWYALLTYRYRQSRAAVRYDQFNVVNVDGLPSTQENGYAVTFAYLFEFWLRHRLGFEYIYVDSQRPSGLPSHLSEGGWQLSYRYRY
jgi:hypothetical protein